MPPKKHPGSGVVTVIGVDPSFSACGLACVEIWGSGAVKILGSEVVRTTPDDDHADRLWDIHVAIREFVGKWNAGDRYVSVYAVEGFAFGAKFQREVQGMVTGAALVSLRVGGAGKIEIVTPMDAKKAACPDFPGWSKAKWAAAGYTKPFKRSMPEKVTVMSGLRRRYGFTGLVDDAIADAACVAIAAGFRHLGVSPDGK